MCVVRLVFVDDSLRYADGEPLPDPDDFDDGCFDDDDDPDFDECGMTADGGCTLAGTEYCDWECPYGG